MTSKSVVLNQSAAFKFGLSTSILRKNTMRFGEGVDIGSRNLLTSFAFQSKFVKTYRRKNKSIVVGLTYYNQSSYRKKKEFDNKIISGQSVPYWYVGSYHMFNYIETYTLSFSILKKNALTFYFQEDFRVSNNSDFQAGFSYSLSICNL